MCSLCIASAQGATAPAALKVADCHRATLWPGFKRFRRFKGSEGDGLPLCGNAYKVSVTGFTFSVIWHSKHYGNQPPPVAFPPPFGGWRHHLSPTSGGTIKLRYAVLLMKGLLCGALLSHRTAGGRWCRKAPKGDCIFSPVRAAVWFSRAKGGIKNGAEGAVPRQRSDTI